MRTSPLARSNPNADPSIYLVRTCDGPTFMGGSLLELDREADDVPLLISLSSNQISRTAGFRGRLFRPSGFDRN